VNEPSAREQQATRWLTIGLSIAAVALLWPFIPWVLVAAWIALAARRVHVPLARRLGSRPGLAAVITVAMLTLLVIPAALLFASLVVDAIALVQQLLTTERAHDLLARLVRPTEGEHPASPDVLGLLMQQSERAWSVGRMVAGTAMRGVVGLFILVSGTYVFLIDGDGWYLWLEANAPIARTSTRRIAAAFAETGHGLFVGLAGAGIAQALAATVVYVAIGVPQPFALGLLTLVFSVVPAVGTAMVWVPVAAGLALTGRPGAAAALVIAGVTLIGTLDNLLRPYLSRRGHLRLPTFVVLLAMFGGIELMGAWGVILGPLIVRLAREMFDIRSAR
jgi:predicted PurR-regulated permease PerM